MDVSNTTREMDPFSYIEEALGGGNEPIATEDILPVTEQPREADPQQEERQLSPEEIRIRDWQAKHDRLQSEFDRYRNQAEDANTIWRVVNSDPALAQRVFSTIEESLSGRSSSADEGRAYPVAAELPPAPKEPERPTDYSESDALMEPQSSSWRYRLALEDYHRQKLQHDMQQGLQQIQQMVLPLRQTYEEQLRERQRQEQMALVYQQFTQAGLPEEESLGVMNWAAKYQITPQDIALLYRHHNQQAPVVQQGQRAPETFRAKAERMAFPTPAATAPRGADQQKGDFFDELLAMEAGRKVL